MSQRTKYERSFSENNMNKTGPPNQQNRVVPQDRVNPATMNMSKKEKKRLEEERKKQEKLEKTLYTKKEARVIEQQKDQFRVTTANEIGLPSNVQHHGHIGWSTEGGFEIKNIPTEWKSIFKQAGIKPRDLKNEQTRGIIFQTVTSYAQSHPSPAAPPTANTRAPPPTPNARPNPTPSVSNLTAPPPAPNARPGPPPAPNARPGPPPAPNSRPAPPAPNSRPAPPAPNSRPSPNSGPPPAPNSRPMSMGFSNTAPPAPPAPAPPPAPSMGFESAAAPPAPPPPPPSSSGGGGGGLLEALQSKQLKHLSIAPQSAPSSGTGGGSLVDTLQNAMANRRLAIDEDEDEDDDWGDEWD